MENFIFVQCEMKILSLDVKYGPEKTRIMTYFT